MKRLAAHVAVAALVLIGVWIVWELSSVVLMFLLSLALAAAVRGGVEYFQRRDVRRTLSLVTVYLLGFALLVVPLVPACGLAFADLQRFSDDALHAFDHWNQQTSRSSPLDDALWQLLPAARAWGSLDDPSQATSLLRTFFGVTFSLVDFAIGLFFVIALSVYWAIDGQRFERLWLSLLPAERRAVARDTWRTLEREVGAYCRSELLQTWATALALATGYWAMGQPYPVLLAMIGALAWLIPWVGVLIAVAAVFVAALPTWLNDGAMVAVGMVVPAAIYTTFVLIFMEFFVEPRLSDRRNYNTLLIAVLTLALAEQLGFAGLLLGPPLAVAAQIIISRGWELAALADAPLPAESPPMELFHRAAALQSRFEQLSMPSPELVGLLGRLNGLLDEARPLLTPAAASNRRNGAATQATT
jgi:predicted PurR-regulated permease PerM